MWNDTYFTRCRSLPFFPEMKANLTERGLKANIFIYKYSHTDFSSAFTSCMTWNPADLAWGGITKGLCMYYLYGWQVPMARASILWLIGEYCDHVPKIAPDVLRKMAKSFTAEEDIVKLQTVNLAAKLYLTNSKQVISL